MNKKILYAGILLYLLIIPFFYHSDIKEIFYKTQFLSQGVFNVYSYIANNPASQLFGQFNYQPLTYYVFGLLFVPIKLLAGSGFQGWLAMGNSAVEVEGLVRYLFLMKLPIVAAFAATGIYLSKMFKKERNKNLILLLWFFNPASIYVVGMIGQFDVFPVLLSVAALYYASRKPALSSVLLGLGAAMKGFPLLLIPFLVIMTKGNFLVRVKVLFAGLLSFVIMILPFVFDRAFFEGAALSGLTQRMFIPGISFGFDEKFLIIPGIYLVLIYYAINFDLGRINNLYKYFFSSMLLVASGVHFHAQWLLWFLPFLLIILVKKDNYKKVIYSFGSIVLLLSYFGTVFLLKDRFLAFGLFSVFDPAVFYLPSPFEIVGKFYSPHTLQSIFHTFYLVSGLTIVMKVIYGKNQE